MSKGETLKLYIEQQEQYIFTTKVVRMDSLFTKRANDPIAELVCVRTDTFEAGFEAIPVRIEDTQEPTITYLVKVYDVTPEEFLAVLSGELPLPAHLKLPKEVLTSLT